jgi:hypothetical protein
MSKIGDEFDPVMMAWCQTIFGSLKEGGRWVHIQVGMVYARRSGALVLVDRMPWDAKVHKCTAAEWVSIQDRAFRLNQQYFGAAGIRVERAQ